MDIKAKKKQRRLSKKQIILFFSQKLKTQDTYNQTDKNSALAALRETYILLDILF